MTDIDESITFIVQVPTPPAEPNPNSVAQVVNDASLTQGASDTTVADFTSQQLALNYPAQLD